VTRGWLPQSAGSPSLNGCVAAVAVPTPCAPNGREFALGLQAWARRYRYT